MTTESSDAVLRVDLRIGRSASDFRDLLSPDQDGLAAKAKNGHKEGASRVVCVDDILVKRKMLHVMMAFSIWKGIRSVGTRTVCATGTRIGVSRG
jgi:hypothetical protein